MASDTGAPIDSIVPAEALGWYLESLGEQEFNEEAGAMEQRRREATGEMDTGAVTGDDDFDAEDARIVEELRRKELAKRKLQRENPQTNPVR